MEFKRAATMAGLVSVLGVVARYVPSVLLDRWVEGGLGGAVPTVGTTGETVTLYSLLTSSLGPLVTLALAVGLGYYVGRRLDLPREYRRFGGAVAVGSLLGVVGAWAVQMAVTPSGPTTAVSVSLNLLVLATLAVRVSLVVTVGVVAGAALSYFRAAERRPDRPTDADTDASSVARESATDDSESHASTT